MPRCLVRCASTAFPVLLLVACNVRDGAAGADGAADPVLAALDHLTAVALRAGHDEGRKRTFAAAGGSLEQEADDAALRARGDYEELLPRTGLTSTQRSDTLGGLAIAYGLGYASARKGQSYDFTRDRMLPGVRAAVRAAAGR